MREFFNNRHKIFNVSAKNLRNLEFDLFCKLQNAQNTLLQFFASYKNSENTQNPYGFYMFSNAQNILIQLFASLESSKKMNLMFFWMLKMNRCEKMLFFNNQHTIFTLSATTKVEKARIHFVLKATTQKSYQTHMGFTIFEKLKIYSSSYLQAEKILRI